jgi:hypothetical protein
MFSEVFTGEEERKEQSLWVGYRGWHFSKGGFDMNFIPSKYEKCI